MLGPGLSVVVELSMMFLADEGLDRCEGLEEGFLTEDKQLSAQYSLHLVISLVFQFTHRECCVILVPS